MLRRLDSTGMHLGLSACGAATAVSQYVCCRQAMSGACLLQKKPAGQAEAASSCFV